MPAAGQHRWGDPVRFTYKTERECLNGCRTVKVTRHEPGERLWLEFWRDLERVDVEGRTPKCEPVMAEAAA